MVLCGGGVDGDGVVVAAVIAVGLAINVPLVRVVIVVIVVIVVVVIVVVVVVHTHSAPRSHEGAARYAQASLDHPGNPTYPGARPRLQSSIWALAISRQSSSGCTRCAVGGGEGRAEGLEEAASRNQRCARFCPPGQQQAQAQRRTGNGRGRKPWVVDILCNVQVGKD